MSLSVICEGQTYRCWRGQWQWTGPLKYQRGSSDRRHFQRRASASRFERCAALCRSASERMRLGDRHNARALGFSAHKPAEFRSALCPATVHRQTGRPTRPASRTQRSGPNTQPRSRSRGRAARECGAGVRRHPRKTGRGLSHQRSTQPAAVSLSVAPRGWGCLLSLRNSGRQNKESSGAVDRNGRMKRQH